MQNTSVQSACRMGFWGLPNQPIGGGLLGWGADIHADVSWQLEESLSEFPFSSVPQGQGCSGEVLTQKKAWAVNQCCQKGHRVKFCTKKAPSMPWQPQTTGDIFGLSANAWCHWCLTSVSNVLYCHSEPTAGPASASVSFFARWGSTQLPSGLTMTCWMKGNIPSLGFA